MTNKHFTNIYKLLFINKICVDEFLNVRDIRALLSAYEKINPNHFKDVEQMYYEAEREGLVTQDIQEGKFWGYKVTEKGVMHVQPTYKKIIYLIKNNLPSVLLTVFTSVLTTILTILTTKTLGI